MSTPETPPPADDNGNPVPKVSDRAALEAALAGAAGLLAGRLLLGKGAGLAAGGAVIAARLIMDWQKNRRAHRETPAAGDGKTGKETKAETETETDKTAGPQAVPVPIPVPVAAAAPIPVSAPNPDVDANANANANADADAALGPESGPAAHSPIMESSVPEASAVTVETIPITTTDSVESAPTGDSQQASGPVETDFPVTESSLPEPDPPAGDAGSGVRNEDADGQVKAQEKENDGIPVAAEPAPAFPTPPVEFVIPETPQDIPGPFFEENPTVEDPVFPDVFQEIDGPAEEEWKPEPPSSSPAPVTAAPHTAPDEYQASVPLPPFPVTSLEPDSDLDSEPGPETLLSAPSRPVPQVADSFNGIGEFPLLPNPESFDGEPTAPDEKPDRDPVPVIGGFPTLGGADDSTALESAAPPPPAPAPSSASPASSLPAFPEMATPTPSLESGDSIAPLPLSKAGGTELQDSSEPETETPSGPKAGPAPDIAPFPETSSPAEEAGPDSITPAPASAPGREENRAEDYATTAGFMEKPEDGKAEDGKDESDESATAAKNLLTEPSGPEPSSPAADSPPESTNAPASVSGFDTPDPLSVFEDEPPEPAASVSGPLLSSTPAPAPISLTTAAPVSDSETPETEKSAAEPPAPAPPIPATPTRFIKPEDVEEFQARIESTPAGQDGNGLDEDQSPSPPSSTLPLPPAASVASARSQDTAVTGMLSPSRQPSVEAEQEEPEIHVAQLTAVADAPASPRPRAEKPGPLPGPPVSHAPLRPLSLPGQPPAGDSPATARPPTPRAKPPVRPAAVPQATVRNSSSSGSASGPGPGMATGEPGRNRSLPAPKGEEKDTLIGGWITTLCSTPLGRFTIILIVAAMAALAVVLVKHLQNASAAQPSGAVMPTPAASGWPPAEYRALAYADGPGAPAWRAWL